MSGKGGVGKTGMAVNVANFCAYYGMRVLLIDCDWRTRGATVFLSISQISLGEGNPITIEHIVDELLNRSIIKDEKKNSIVIDNVERNQETQEDSKADQSQNGVQNGLGSLIRIKEGFEFIPSGLKAFDLSGIILKFLSDQNLELQFQLQFQQLISDCRRKYELILFDLGAGNDKFNGILNSMADRICVMAENNEISLKSVRDFVGELCSSYGVEKIVECFNKLSEKDKEYQFTSFSAPCLKGFDYRKDYADIYDKGDLLNPEESQNVESLIRIIRELGIDAEKIENEIEKRSREKEEREKKERIDKEGQEKLRKQEDIVHIASREIRRMQRWVMAFQMGVVYILVIGAGMVTNYWGQAAVMVYVLVNFMITVLLIMCCKWLKSTIEKIEKFFEMKGKINEEGQRESLE